MSSTATATLQPAATQRLRTRLLTRMGFHPPAAVAVTVVDSDQARTNGLDIAVLSPTPLSSSEGRQSATPQTPPPPTSATCTPPSTSPPHTVPSPPAVPRRTALAVTTEVLKYDPLADARFARKRKRRANGGGVRPRKCLAFRETVRVVPIPLRSEYSARVRARLWSSAAELYENAVRNTVEFAHEGYDGRWDWRKVCEDEHMHVCIATGELIHPCHYTMAGVQPPEKE